MQLGLRVTDQETARVVAVRKASGEIVGAGCLVSAQVVLTCRHVVAKAVGAQPDNVPIGSFVDLTLVGLTEAITVRATVGEISAIPGYADDLALLHLQLDAQIALHVPPVEFATPLRHSGKSFFVMGFPGGTRQGVHSSGTLHGADAFGLVQMDGRSPLLVQGGFSGAPIWSPDVGAFVGLVVAAALHGESIAWCIPSRLLCSFYNDLLVRFRVPVADRPTIHDYAEDDPNAELFSLIEDNGSRKLTAKVEWDDEEERYVVEAKYRCVSGSAPPRGGYVTFLTYPGFGGKKEDSYELFAQLEKGVARTEFYPKELFTLAAIGDGGDTVLTIDLTRFEK